MSVSLKKLAADGSGNVKKTDLFRVKFGLLKVEPGFNLRDLEEPETKEHIHGIFMTIMNGGEVPPLEVRTDEDGNIWIVDGHCRHAGYGMAIAAGAPIEYIDVLPYRGNDAERVAKMIISSQGKALTPLETAMGYKRLFKFKWDETQIANYVGRSTEQVKQLLILANANTDVHQFVKRGAISAYTAIDIIRVHGEKSGAFIAQQLAAAQAKGQNKVTTSSIQGRALPKKIVTGLVSSVNVFAERLDNRTRKSLAELENTPEEQLKGKTVEVDAAALLELLRAHSAVDEVQKKQAEKAQAKEAAAKQETMDV